MQIVSLGGIDLESNALLSARLVYGDEGTSTAQVSHRMRNERAPSMDRVSYGARSIPFRVIRDTSAVSLQNTAQVAAFNEEVGRVFSPRLPVRELVIKPHKDATENRTAQVKVVSLRKAEDGVWQGTFESTDGVWRSLTEQTETTFPFTVDGNTSTYPVLHVSGGDAVTRYRVTPRDRTGHGLSAELVRIPLDLTPANTEIYVNGLAQPFRNAGGALWVRVDIPPGGTTPIDVYTGTAIENTETADMLDSAGLDLESSTMASLRYESWQIETHPLSATGTWRPGLVTKHASGRPYSFGLTDPSIAEFTLVDRLAGRRRWDLPDNFDAAIAVSGPALASLQDATFDVFAGYNPTEEPDTTNTVQTLRFDIPGGYDSHDFYGEFTIDFGGTLGIVSIPESEPVGPTPLRNETRGVFDDLAGGSSNIGTIIQGLQTGSNLTFHIEFTGAFEGQRVQPFSVVSHDFWGIPNSGPVEQIEVNTIPFIDYTAGTITPSKIGDPCEITAFIAVAKRDEQDWTEVWSETFRGGFPDGITDTVTIASLNLRQSHRVAIGLRASSTDIDTPNWGKLTIKGTPTLARNSNQVPSLTISDPIPARLKQGAILNPSTGERIILQHVLTDDVDLVIDTSGDEFGERGVKPETGPMYRRGIERTNPATWLSLVPGQNDIDSPFDVTVTYRNAWEL